MLAKRATRPDEGTLAEIERVRDLTEARDRSANVQIGPSGSELNSEMKDGLFGPLWDRQVLWLRIVGGPGCR